MRFLHWHNPMKIIRFDVCFIENILYFLVVELVATPWSIFFFQKSQPSFPLLQYSMENFIFHPVPVPLQIVSCVVGYGAFCKHWPFGSQYQCPKTSPRSWASHSLCEIWKKWYRSWLVEIQKVPKKIAPKMIHYTFLVTTRLKALSLTSWRSLFKLDIELL